jgi:hypothetical protein
MIKRPRPVSDDDLVEEHDRHAMIGPKVEGATFKQTVRKPKAGEIDEILRDVPRRARLARDP